MTEVITTEGEIINTPDHNVVYLGLFDQGRGWCVSGVIYHNPNEIPRNLAAFMPHKILIVKVVMPAAFMEWNGVKLFVEG